MSYTEIDSSQLPKTGSREERLALFSQIQIVGRLLEVLPVEDAHELNVELAEISAQQRRSMVKLRTSGIYYGS